MLHLTTTLDPEAVVTIAKVDGRYSAGYFEWNADWMSCETAHPQRPLHLTRTDAVSCAEERLAYRA